MNQSGYASPFRPLPGVTSAYDSRPAGLDCWCLAGMWGGRARRFPVGSSTTKEGFMRRFRAIAIAAVVFAAAAPARSDAPLPAALQVLGTVTNSARPVANALVIALNLQDLQS